METVTNQIEPKLGEGIYLVKDVAKILQLDYAKTYRWIAGYWNGGLEENIRYTFGEVGNRAINFLSLIEFYTFFKLRDRGLSATQIKGLHHELSLIFGTPYPFAYSNDFYIEARRKRKDIHYVYKESLIKFDKKHQISFDFMVAFFDKVEFDDNNLAVRFFPLAASRNVVVDPKRQFGQPTIEGTNIKTSTIYNYYLGGESNKSIANMYDLNIAQVKDAIKFSKAA